MGGEKVNRPTVGFAVIYRWKLKPGREEAFRQAWEATTLDLKERRSGLGSRLHQAADGTWVAYAQWPSRETWARSRDLGSVDPEASAAMAAAIEESFDHVELHPIRDLLDRG